MRSIHALGLLVLACWAATPAGAETPPSTGAAAASRQPAARATLAEYRGGDLLWENDLTAHRIYGHPLEALEPPSGSGIDAWGKGVAYPYMDGKLRQGRQHVMDGEGVDFFHVGGSRGVGGLGIWFDNKLWLSRNYREHRIVHNGPDRVEFEVKYAPWPVDVKRKVWETRRFTLPLGTHFTRMESTIGSNRSEPLIVGIGLTKTGVGSKNTATIDRAAGLVWSWQGDSEHGAMGVAIRVDPTMIVDVREDLDNFLVLLKVTPGKPFVYYNGAAWSNGRGNVRTKEDWEKIVRAERVDFKPAAAARLR